MLDRVPNTPLGCRNELIPKNYENVQARKLIHLRRVLDINFICLSQIHCVESDQI